MITKLYTCKVIEAWTDYNHHLNDASYARIFSLCVDQFMQKIGLGQANLHRMQYTLFTIETHVRYLKEVLINEDLTVYLQVLDYDLKRAHVFFTMKNSREQTVATSEEMLIGIDFKTRRPAAFPNLVHHEVKSLYQQDQTLPTPDGLGHTIEMRR